MSDRSCKNCMRWVTSIYVGGFQGHDDSALKAILKPEWRECRYIKHAFIVLEDSGGRFLKGHSIEGVYFTHRDFYCSYWGSLEESQ